MVVVLAKRYFVVSTMGIHVFADGVLAGVVEAWGKGSRRLLAGAGSPEHPVLAVARRSRAEQQQE